MDPIPFPLPVERGPSNPGQQAQAPAWYYHLRGKPCPRAKPLPGLHLRPGSHTQLRLLSVVGALPWLHFPPLAKKLPPEDSLRTPETAPDPSLC